jgi:hypothetical protein
VKFGMTGPEEAFEGNDRGSASDFRGMKAMIADQSSVRGAWAGKMRSN